MNAEEIISNLQAGRISLNEILPDDLGILVVGPPFANSETTISQELIELRIKDFENLGHLCGRICHINSENQVVNGFPYRSPEQ